MGGFQIPPNTTKYMQVNIIEVKSMIKNVNTYNMSSFLTNILDNEPNRNSNQLN